MLLASDIGRGLLNAGRSAKLSLTHLSRKRNFASAASHKPMEPGKQGRWLVAFDFDHTVVDGNSDTWYGRSIFVQIYRTLDGHKLPDSVRSQYEKGYWTRFMNVVFRYLHDQKVTKAQLALELAQMPLTPGMKELLEHLRARPDKYECVILSDANTYFIDTILEAKGLAGVFCKVFSNPASFQPDGLLQIDPHHSHACPTCSVNLCKQAVLRQYVQQGGPYAGIAYLGDGQNDLCPATSMEQADVVFPRVGFALHRLLTSADQQQATSQSAEAVSPYDELQPTTINAQVVPWSSAEEVVRWLKENVG